MNLEKCSHQQYLYRGAIAIWTIMLDFNSNQVLCCTFIFGPCETVVPPQV